MKPLLTLWFTLWLLLTGFVPAYADSAIPPAPRPIPYNSPDPVPGTGLYFVGLATVDGDTHFRYELRGAGRPAVSNVVLQVCTAKLFAVLIEPSHNTHVEVKDGSVKIETPNMADFETRIITLIMTGTGWSAAPTTYTLKAGTQVTTGASYGPTCTPTAVTLAGLAADSARMDWRDVLLLALLACALLLVRWALRAGKRL